MTQTRSLHGRRGHAGQRALLVLLSGWLALTPAPQLLAQYPGHIETRVKAGPVLRSIAVLEWTGQSGKPSASRLIPISVYEDGAYQAGGLYLARPAPMALESGTEYQLLRAGLPQGIFDVAMAQQTGSEWVGYGTWKPLPAPAPFHKLKPSKIDPEVVDGGSDRRPHFRKAAPDADAPGGGSANTPPEDPDRPTLRKRAGQASDGQPAPGTDNAAAMNGNPETATPGADPDRPRLTRGIPKEQAKAPEHLEGTPPNLEQMVAVSDAETRPEHSFAYNWASPEDAAKMQAKLEDLARKAIASATPIGKPAASTGTGHAGTAQTSTAQGSTAHPATTGHAATGTATHLTPAHAAARRRALARKAAAAPAVTLSDVQFHAYELTYSGGTTLVLSARTAGDDARARYVTLIAQPDIYGVPQVLFTQVTRADDLDTSPSLRLIDAVDAAADNRGELLFELRGATARQFALYRVASGRVDQMIATGPLPLSHAVAE